MVRAPHSNLCILTDPGSNPTSGISFSIKYVFQFKCYLRNVSNGTCSVQFIPHYIVFDDH